MDSKVKLPIGIEDFVKIRTEGFYYVIKQDSLRNCWKAGEK